MSNDLPKAITEMNALPDISTNDSARLQGFVRTTTTEIKAVGGVGAATTLEMIGYIRELEHKLVRTPIVTEKLIDPWHATEDDYRLSPASAAPVVDENSAAFTAYNQAVEDAKAAIREAPSYHDDDDYCAASFINAIARRCSPHVYVNRLAAATAAPQQSDAETLVRQWVSTLQDESHVTDEDAEDLVFRIIAHASEQRATVTRKILAAVSAQSIDDAYSPNFKNGFWRGINQATEAVHSTLR